MDKKNADVNQRVLKYRCKFRGCLSAYYTGTTAKFTNKHFYRFPKNKDLLSKWKSVCKVPNDLNYENIFVCEDHFLQRDFVNKHRKRLNPGVFPKHLEIVPFVPVVPTSNNIGSATTSSNSTPFVATNGSNPTASINIGSNETQAAGGEQNYVLFNTSCESCISFPNDSHEMAFNFDGLCRLCMKQEKKMSPIFTEENSLLIKLSHILPKLEIQSGDGLPSEVCRECVQQIHTSHYFFTQCEVSDSTFRKYLKKQIICGKRESMPTADVEQQDHENCSTLRISSVFSLGTPTCSNDSGLNETLQDTTAQHSRKGRVKHTYEGNLRETHDGPQVNNLQAISQAVANNSPTRKSGKLRESNRLNTPVVRKNPGIQKSEKLQEPSISNIATPVVISQQTKDSSLRDKPGKLQKANISSIDTEQMATMHNKNCDPLQNSVQLQDPQSDSVMLSCDNKRLMLSSTSKETQKPNSATVATQLMVLQMDKNSLASSNPVLKLHEDNNQVQLASATTIPPLVLLPKNRNSLTTKTSIVKLEKCSNGSEVGNVATIPPLVLLPKNRNSLTTDSSTVKLEKCNNGARVDSVANIPPLVLLPKNRNSLATNNSTVKLEKCNNGARLDSVANIPPLVLLPKNKNSLTTNNSTVKLEKCNNGASVGSVANIPPLVLLPKNKNSLTTNSSTVKLEKCNNGASVITTPPAISSGGHENSLTSDVSPVKLQKLTNEVKENSGVSPVASLQEKTDLMSSNSHTEKLKTYKYSKWKYFIPVQFLEQNKNLNLQKPVSSGSAAPISGNISDGSVSSNITNGLSASCEPKQLPEHTCKDCGLKFTNKGEWWKHWQSHKVFKCSDCGLQLSSAFKLKVHRRRKHTVEKPVAALCEKCGLSFTNHSVYVNHLNTHLGIRPFQCPECKKCYTSKSILTSHRRIHTGEKPFICEKCGWCFRYAPALIRHRLLHDEHKRPYKCTLCPKTYRSRSSLKIHLMVHTGEKPFKCPDCDHAFSHKGLLTRHKIVHTGERKYKCPICDKLFTTSSSKMHHVRMHTGNAPYKCGDCGKVYACHKYFTNHILKVHGRQE